MTGNHLTSLCLALAAVVTAGGCKVADTPVTLTVQARVGATPFACGQTYAPGDWTPTDLRLFVHDVRLLTAGGEEVPLALDDDATWQDGRVALLDFEDGTGACANGTEETRTTITGRAPAGKTYTGVALRVGVPFAANHANPALAAGPLAYTSMHWSWQGGYKFLRMGARRGDEAWKMHLGSTGCQGTIGAITGCDRPNRPEVMVRGVVPDRDTLVLDVGRVLEGVALKAPGCMAAPGDPDCERVMANLGLAPASGLPSGPSRVFGAAGP